MPATWSKNTVTNQAMTMMNHALGVSAITFTKAVMITDDITKDTVSQLQALTTVNYKQTRVPRVISTEDDRSRVGVTIDNSDVNEDYAYYGVALYGKQNSTNEEILFSVIPLTTAATMVANENNVATSSIYLDIYTDIVRGTQITIMVSNSGTLSREDVEQMIKTEGYITKDDLPALIADNLPKGIVTDDASKNWQKHKVTADDGTPKVVIGYGDDANAKINGLVGTADAGTISIDIGATNNGAAHSVLGYYSSAKDWAVILAQTSDGTEWSISTTGTTVVWTQIPNNDLVKQKADDSKVPHLSGANNFDTVPTVNNNPLLLASSLPSDLARTGSDQEFTGKNTFDTAPIDKTTGNPYITKDGVPAVPSTLADTTKLANFTAGLQSGGVSVATSDDLKSVENSAWRQLSITNENNEVALCKIDGNKLWVFWSFSKDGDEFYKSYSIGEIPSSIQGKKFNGFNSCIMLYNPNDSLDPEIVISSTSIVVNYNGYPGPGGVIIYGYFTFK